jgi:hypothetical protein
MRYGTDVLNTGLVPTINTAVPSLNGAPRPLAVQSPYLPARRR